VLFTNIAETSIALPNVQYVIDCGKTRKKRYDPMTSVEKVGSTWISKTNSVQRSGRAGRVQDGCYYGLYSKERYDSLPSEGNAEILCSDLSNLCLLVKAQALPAPIRKFFAQAPEPPSETSVNAAFRLLQNLGALTQDEEITSVGTILAALPVHPAKGKRLLLGILFRCIEPIAILSAVARDDPLYGSPEISSLEQGRVVRCFVGDFESDQIGLINAYRELDAILKSRDQEQTQRYIDRNYMRKHVYREMRARLPEIYEDLRRVGLLSPRFLRDPFSATPDKLNKNAENVNLIKALIASCPEPNIAALFERRKKFWATKDKKVVIYHRSVNTYAYPLDPVATAMSNRHRRGDIVTLAMKRLKYGYYHPILIDTTICTHLTAILFSTQASIEENVIRLDGWLPLQVCGEGQSDENIAAKIVMEFRKAVHHFMLIPFADARNVGKMQLDGDNVGDASRVDVMFTHEQPLREAIVEGVVRVLDADAKAWREARGGLHIPKTLEDHKQQKVKRVEKKQSRRAKVERGMTEPQDSPEEAGLNR
jgi:ATP-dependent RNA helicase DHX36